MKRLIVLSDLWGKGKSNWFVEYEKILKKHFDICFYDCCELAEIDLYDLSEEKIHFQFINGGIERAVKALLDKEKGKIDLLGFSIGGLIAWKATVDGLKVGHLSAISATRLRFEEKKPKCSINLFYGENDKYKPSEEWFRKFNIEMNIYEKQKHCFYNDKKTAIDVSKKIIEQSESL